MQGDKANDFLESQQQVGASIQMERDNHYATAIFD